MSRLASRSASRALAAPPDQLFASMNVTPFIDVMLVLLVMLIITIPMQTHAVKIVLPTDGAFVPGKPHKLGIDAGGALYWDGVRVTDSQLPGLLNTTLRENADLQLQTDAATRYERFDQVLAIVKRGGITKLGFVGNEHMTF